MEKQNDWKTKILLLGGAAGLLTGLAAAYLYIKQKEQTGQGLKITSSDGLKIGLNTISLVKMISEMGLKK